VDSAAGIGYDTAYKVVTGSEVLKVVTSAHCSCLVKRGLLLMVFDKV
jgi:hypothetical protein